MKVRLTPQAIADLASIADYIRERNPAAAIRVRDAIFESLERLVLFPRRGRRQDMPGVRRLVTRRYPYLVYYEIDAAADEVSILAIRRPAREREHEDA
jgi:toxin ParE1/3/4